MSPWLPFAHADYSISETRDWLRRKPSDWRNGYAYDFGIFDAAEGTILGGCGINNIDYQNRCANLGYWVRTASTGRGIATRATLLLAGFGFKDIGLTRIEILVATGNQHSQKVAEKVGAVREGVLRNRIVVREKTYDCVIYSLIPGDIPEASIPAARASFQV